MEVFFHKNFSKRLERLSPRINEQFRRRLGLFIKNRFHRTLNNHSVDPGFPHCRSMNVTGDIRAIFRESGDEILFVDIGTHSDLYG